MRRLQIVLCAFVVGSGNGDAGADDPKPGGTVPAPTTPDPIQLASWLEKAFDGGSPPEAARMLIAIARGSQMGPGDGWFGPAQTAYTWDWLAKRHDIDPAKGAISKDKFRGAPEL